MAQAKQTPVAAPLAGFRVIEFGGIGPGPFAAMMLADAGAEVVRVDRRDVDIEVFGLRDVTWRGRAERIRLDLKDPADHARAVALVQGADALIEGFRPGVMERLGLGPEVFRDSHPALVYGRMTGWGQSSPKAHDAGHDINYLALSGVLHAIGPPDRPPPPPINFVADYGGGGMMLAFGIVAAVLRARQAGVGAVVDAAMLDGAALQSAQMQGWHSQGGWSDARGCNYLDGGAPFYRCYETRCGGYLAVGAIEAKFYRALLAGLGLEAEPLLQEQHDRTIWPQQSARIAERIRERDRDEWVQVFAGAEACVEPVLTLAEARAHPANLARRVFFEAEDLWHPAPAPRFTPLEAAPDLRTGEE